MMYSEFDDLLTRCFPKEHKAEAISPEVYTKVIEPMYMANEAMSKDEFVSLFNYKALLKLEDGYNLRIVKGAVRTVIDTYNRALDDGLDDTYMLVDWESEARIRQLCPEGFRERFDNYRLLRYLQNLMGWICRVQKDTGCFSIEFSGSHILGVRTEHGFI